MKNKIVNFLLFIAIIFITVVAIILNLDKDFNVTLKSIIVTILYLISWIVFINIGLKNKVKSMIVFYYLVWGVTLVTSISVVLVNAMPYLSEYFSFIIVLVLIFLTPISGLGFLDSHLLAGVMFSIASAIFMLIPTIKTRYIKLKEKK